MAEKKAKQAILDKEEQKKNEVYPHLLPTRLALFPIFPYHLKYHLDANIPPENTHEGDQGSPRCKGGAPKARAD
jgi:hypothetical protein